MCSEVKWEWRKWGGEGKQICLVTCEVSIIFYELLAIHLGCPLVFAAPCLLPSTSRETLSGREEVTLGIGVCGCQCQSPVPLSKAVRSPTAFGPSPWCPESPRTENWKPWVLTRAQLQLSLWPWRRCFYFGTQFPSLSRKKGGVWSNDWLNGMVSHLCKSERLGALRFCTNPFLVSLPSSFSPLHCCCSPGERPITVC